MNDQSEPKNESGSAWPVIAKLQDKVTDISWSIFSVGFLVSLLSVGYEAFVWLKTGESADLRFFSVFVWLNIDIFTPLQNIEWQGIKKILVWCLELPLSIGLLAASAAFGGLLYALFSRKE